MMQLRAKRATSEPPPVPDQSPRPKQRRIADPSRKEAMLAMLQIEPTRDNCAGYLMFPGKFRLLVKGDQWTKWSQDTTSIPMYILEGLHNTKALANTNNENAWMELTEENFRAGDNYVVDEIETEGAEMLTTKYGQTEIAFAVTGRDVKCAGHRFAMIGPPREHGQYIGSIPRGLFAEQILDNYAVDGHGEKYQTKERVMFGEPLKNMSACSWMVYTRELEKDELRTVSCARIPANIAATQKLPAHLMLGMGFETK